MPSYEYTFKWEKNGKTLVLPVKVAKKIDSNWYGGDTLICNNCEMRVEQFYRCSNCEELLKIGQIKKRKNRDTGLIYLEAERKQFLQQAIIREIIVKHEIPLNALLPKHLDKLSTSTNKEMFNNEKHMNYLLKFKEMLMLRGMALLCVMGWYGKMRKVAIIPTWTGISIVDFRDKRLIRKPNQQNYVYPEQTQMDRLIERFCEDKSIDKFYDFLKAKMNGIEIKVEEPKEEEPQIEGFEDFFEMDVKVGEKPQKQKISIH